MCTQSLYPRQSSRKARKLCESSDSTNRRGRVRLWRKSVHQHYRRLDVITIFYDTTSKTYEVKVRVRDYRKSVTLSDLLYQPVNHVGWTWFRKQLKIASITGGWNVFFSRETYICKEVHCKVDTLGLNWVGEILSYIKLHDESDTAIEGWWLCIFRLCLIPSKAHELSKTFYRINSTQYLYLQTFRMQMNVPAIGVQNVRFLHTDEIEPVEH